VTQLPNDYIPVLDHGFVGLVDSMGDDDAIVQAARVSIAGQGVKATSSDLGLIRYLLRHRHTTPFEMVEFKFHAKMPIFVARQWVRHRTASINEMSGRYSEIPEEFYVPELGRIQKQASKNKQGSALEQVADAEAWQKSFTDEAHKNFHRYRDRLNEDMARELARINLPLSSYTEWYWKIDLHNLMHFLSLRLHPHAQMEIRVFAEAMAQLVKPIVPAAWQAFEDYRLNGMFLTANELAALNRLLERTNVDIAETVIADLDFPTKREAREFGDKLSKLGLRITGP